MRGNICPRCLSELGKEYIEEGAHRIADGDVVCEKCWWSLLKDEEEPSLKRTGVFYHEICGKEAYKTLAMSVEEGFESLVKAGFFEKPNVILIESEPASEEELLKVHTHRWIEEVKKTRWWRVSPYSTGGMVSSTEKVLSGEIDNALVFVGVGGHHAHPDSAWGGCFFNMMAVAIRIAREKGLGRRFAIIDTDTHHADGTRDIFLHDEDVLHICFCGYGESLGRTKICLSHGLSDDEEVEILEREVPWRVGEFKPDLIYWVCGLDTHRDSYGTRRLTENCYPRLAKVIRDMADKICDGKLVVKTGCNAPAYVSEFVMPRILSILSGIGFSLS